MKPPPILVKLLEELIVEIVRLIVQLSAPPNNPVFLCSPFIIPHLCCRYEKDFEIDALLPKPTLPHEIGYTYPEIVILEDEFFSKRHHHP